MVEKKWVNISGYRDEYEVSNFGDVRKIRTKKLMKPTINNKGYLRVRLLDGKSRKNVRVHRLVAEYFLDKPDMSLTVNHKDGDKSNNHISNLELVSPLENIIHALDNGLHISMVSREDVIDIRDLREKGLSYTEIGSLFPVCENGVRDICLFNTFKHVI